MPTKKHGVWDLMTVECSVTIKTTLYSSDYKVLHVAQDRDSLT